MNDYLWDPLGVKLVNGFATLKHLRLIPGSSTSLFARLLPIRGIVRSELRQSAVRRVDELFVLRVPP